MYSFFQSSRFAASKSRSDAFLSKIISTLSLVKAGKSCNDFNLPPAKVSKRYNYFDSSLAKLAKMVTSFFNQLNLPPANVFFFGGREGKNQLDLLQAKFAKNAILESKIKNIAWNHIHDLSKQLVIKARNLKL